MLATSARGAIRVDPEICGINLYVNVVVDLGGYKHRGKGGVATTAAVEGRLSYQSMNTRLGAEPAKSIVSLELNGRTFEAGDLAR